jgi:hypothetical protein
MVDGISRLTSLSCVAYNQGRPVNSSSNHSLLQLCQTDDYLTKAHHKKSTFIEMYLNVPNHKDQFLSQNQYTEVCFFCNLHI